MKPIRQPRTTEGMKEEKRRGAKASRMSPAMYCVILLVTCIVCFGLFQLEEDKVAPIQVKRVARERLDFTASKDALAQLASRKTGRQQSGGAPVKLDTGTDNKIADEANNVLNSLEQAAENDIKRGNVVDPSHARRRQLGDGDQRFGRLPSAIAEEKKRFREHGEGAGADRVDIPQQRRISEDAAAQALLANKLRDEEAARRRAAKPNVVDLQPDPLSIGEPLPTDINGVEIIPDADDVSRDDEQAAEDLKQEQELARIVHGAAEHAAGKVDAVARAVEEADEEQARQRDEDARLAAVDDERRKHAEAFAAQALRDDGKIAGLNGAQLQDQVAQQQQATAGDDADAEAEAQQLAEQQHAAAKDPQAELEREQREAQLLLQQAMNRPGGPADIAAKEKAEAEHNREADLAQQKQQAQQEQVQQQLAQEAARQRGAEKPAEEILPSEEPALLLPHRKSRIEDNPLLAPNKDQDPFKAFQEAKRRREEGMAAVAQQSRHRVHAPGAQEDARKHFGLHTGGRNSHERQGPSAEETLQQFKRHS